MVRAGQPPSCPANWTAERCFLRPCYLNPSFGLFSLPIVLVGLVIGGIARASSEPRSWWTRLELRPVAAAIWRTDNPD